MPIKLIDNAEKMKEFQNVIVQFLQSIHKNVGTSKCLIPLSNRTVYTSGLLYFVGAFTTVKTDTNLCLRGKR